MIQALLDLADALLLTTPAPFGKRPIHYFLDLDLDGNLIGISPTCRNTEKGEERLGKEFECPAFFPLILKEGEIKANGGGGIAVAELASGDTREVFRTSIILPKGKDPRFEHLEPPASSDESEPDPNDDIDEDDSEAENAKTKKNQFYRHAKWKRLHKQLFKGIRASGKLNRHHWSLWKFIVRAKHLDSVDYLRLLTLPDQEQAAGETAEDLEKERKRLKQARNRALKDLGSSQFAFRVAGKIMLKDPAMIDWWRDEYVRLRMEIAVQLQPGDDGYSFPKLELVQATKRLTPVFPNIKGVPKSGTWCPLASFDKAPFKSYGLGKMTAPVCLETAERVSGALNFLLKHPQHHYKLGNAVAIFWAIRPSGRNEPLNFCDLLDGENNPDPLEVLDFLKNIHGHAAEPPNESRFFCALLSSPKSRVTVRSWHTDTLQKVTSRSRDYFETVTLPTVWGDRKTSSLTDLANSTIADSSKGGPPNSTYTAIFNCAFFGPKADLPSPLFVQALRRQTLELASGFDAKSQSDFESRLRHRIALIQLFFRLNDGITTNHETIMNTKETAILCGRLLAILDKIHEVAHDGKSASSPANRLYGAASATPALVFPKLCQLARYHLQKMDAGMARKLEYGVPKDRRDDGEQSNFDGLAAIVASLKESSGDDFPRLLSLEDQGRFALGFYYERCRKWPNYTKGNTDKVLNQ